MFFYGWYARPNPEVRILTPDQRTRLPPAYRIQTAVRHLSDNGRHRPLIELVEAWSQADEPSTEARLLQARALVALGLVDRAWARLQGLVEDTAPSVDVYALTIELFIARQWRKKARELTSKALSEHPDDPALTALWEGLAEAGTQPDLSAIEVDDADTATQLTTVHHLLCTGSHTRARTLLERLQKRAPDHTQVVDLLWALDGDLVPDEDLHTLVNRHAPDLSTLAELGDEPEHTESTARADLSPEERQEKASFPSLFRDLEPQTEMIDIGHFQDEADEVTKVSSVVDLASLDTLSDATQTGEVTQIQRVVHHNSDPEPSDTAFDLGTGHSDFTAPEAEDEDVVLLTRRDDERTETATGPTSDLALEPTPPPPDIDRLTDDEAETWVRPRPDLEDDVSADDLAEVPQGASSTWWLVALLGITGVSLASFALLVVLGLWS